MPSLRHRLGLALLLLLVAPLASASISLPLPWKQGMELRYRVHATDDSLRPDRSRNSDSNSTVHVQIREADAKGFLQVWTSRDGKTVVTGNANDVETMRRLGDAMDRRFAELPIEVELEPDGTFRRVRNWRDYASVMREQMMPALLAQGGDRLKSGKFDEAAARERLTPLLDKLTGEQAVSTMVGKQAMVLNFFTAATLSEGKPREYQDYLPSPWSADLIPTRGSFTLEQVTPERVTIHWTQGIDPERGAQVMWSIVETLTGQVFTGEEKKKLPTTMDMRDEARAVIERSTGIPLRIEYSRQVRAGEFTKSSTLVMERLP